MKFNQFLRPSMQNTAFNDRKQAHTDYFVLIGIEYYLDCLVAMLNEMFSKLSPIVHPTFCQMFVSCYYYSFINFSIKMVCK